jgi:RNA polymerase sigma-70 factor, ECF subfamily
MAVFQRAATGGRLETLPDDELVVALADDLDGTFERLVLAYQDRLYGFALRMTGSRPDAEEVAQDTFVRAYRALASYPAERIRALAPRPWLYRIALNVVRNRARRWRPTLVPLDGTLAERHEPPDPAERPEAAAERAEEQDRLGALIAALPARYRAAVVLRHIDDLGYAEVAALLDQPVGTVKANVHRGIRLLRDALQRDQSRVERFLVEVSR